MNRMLRLSPFLALGFAGLALLPACAQGGGSTDKAAVEKIVEEYILTNPEIIEKALVALTEKERAAQASAAKAAIADNASELYNKSTDYSVGPEDAAVTVVEFFDYRCGYCKRSAEWTANLPETYDGRSGSSSRNTRSLAASARPPRLPRSPREDRANISTCILP